MYNKKLDRKLIQMVKEHKMLYDYHHPMYRNSNSREMAWQKISDAMKRPVRDCKKRWVNMRDANLTIMRNSAKNNSKLYKYHDDLAFLLPFYQNLLPPESRENLDSDGHEKHYFHNLEETKTTKREKSVESDEVDKPAQSRMIKANRTCKSNDRASSSWSSFQRISKKLDRKLIRLVKEHKLLYDFNHHEYRNSNARELAWQKISEAMSVTVKDCKKRWADLRDVNRTLMIKSVKRGTKLYKYYDDLTFMIPFYKTPFVPKRNNNFYSDDENYIDQITKPMDRETSIESDESDQPEQEREVIKRRESVNKNSQPYPQLELSVKEDQRTISISCVDTKTTSNFNTSDQVDSFLSSIGDTLKRLTPYHLNLAKTEIFSIVQKRELQMIEENPLLTEHNYVLPK